MFSCTLDLHQYVINWLNLVNQLTKMFQLMDWSPQSAHKTCSVINIMLKLSIFCPIYITQFLLWHALSFLPLSSQCHCWSSHYYHCVTVLVAVCYLCWWMCNRQDMLLTLILGLQIFHFLVVLLCIFHALWKTESLDKKHVTLNYVRTHLWLLYPRHCIITYLPRTPIQQFNI